MVILTTILKYKKLTTTVYEKNTKNIYFISEDMHL